MADTQYDEALAMYVRVHLLGASGGVRLAQILADDPWMDGALDHLPGELREEVDFAKQWATRRSRLVETWVHPVFAVTAVAGRAVRALRPFRRQIPRALALEVMRSLVLAKKAMWELGLSLNADDGGVRETLMAFDEQASRQADELRSLHARASREAFSGRQGAS